MPAARKTVWIRQLQIDGFGQFHNLELTLTQGLNVLHGQNEAGKSTLFAFIRAVLFGFSSRRSAQNRYEPKAAGPMGGRVVLATPDGDLVVSRLLKKNKTDGELTVRDGKGEPQPESRLHEALANMDRELFESVFSLTLKDLRDFEQLAKEKTVASALFVSGVPGASRVPQAIDQLQRQADELFRPRGSKVVLNEALDQLKALKVQIDALGDRPQEYRFARQRLETLDAEMPAAVAQRHEAEDRLRRAELLLKWKPDLERGRRAELALEDLGLEPTLDALALDRLESALAEQAKARDEAQAAERDNQQLLATREALEKSLWPKPALQAAADAVHAAMRLQDIGDKLEARARQLEAAQRQRREDATRLGIDVEQTVATEVMRQRFVSLKERLEKAEPMRLLAAEAHRKAKDEHDAEAAEVARRDAELKGLPEVDSAAVDLALEALHSLAELEATLPDRRARRDAVRMQWAAEQAAAAERAQAAKQPSWLRFGWASIVVLLLMPLVVALVHTSWLPVVAAGTLPLAALLAFILVRGMGTAVAPLPSTDHGARLAEIEAELAALEARWAQRNEACGRKPHEPFHELKVRWEHERRSGLARAQLVHELAALRRRLAQAEEGVRATAANAEAQEAACGQLEVEVAAALSEAKLPAGLLPSAAVMLLDKAASLQRQALDEKARAAEWEKDRQRWEEAVGMLRASAQAVGLSAESDGRRLLELLRANVEEQQKRAQRVEGIAERLAGVASAASAAQTRAAARDEAVSAMLAHGRCESVEAFRALASKSKEAAALRRTLNEVATAVEGALGLSLAEARKQLAALEPLEATVEQCKHEVRERAAAVSKAEQQRGELKHQLAAWENDGQLHALRYEEERLKTRISALAREVTTARMAAAMLSKAMQDFEKHHQPRLLTRAGEVFKQLTLGRYLRLLAPGGDAANLLVTDQQGTEWEAGELSRGTQDQLFLAFRVAVAEEVGEKRHPLPLMVDDVTVNFDEARGEAAVRMLAELSKRQQVVVFSCQAMTKRWLEAAGANSVPVGFKQQQLRLLPLDANG